LRLPRYWTIKLATSDAIDEARRNISSSQAG
jgi:hypothetical protein